MAIEVLQTYTPNIVPYAIHSMRSVGAYAMRNGYDYNARCMTECPPYWGKVYAMLESRAEWIFYVDCDVLVQHHNVKVESFMESMKPQHLIGVCDDLCNGGTINCGVLLIRNTPAFKHLCRQWIQYGIDAQFTRSALYDQDALRAMMSVKAVSDSVCVFPNATFNSNGVGPIPSSYFIAHYMARSLSDRLWDMVAGS